MTQTRDIRSWFARAARVVLVFALVFYTSLRVEILVAYGDEPTSSDYQVEHPSDHNEGSTVADVAIYEWVTPETGSPSWQAVQYADSTEASQGKEAVIQMKADDPSRYFAVVSTWDEAAAPSDGEGEGDGKSEAAAEADESQKTAIAGTDLAKWTATKDGEAQSAYVAQHVSADNVLKVDADADGMTFACAVADDKYGTAEASFRVEVESVEPEPTPEPDVFPITDVSLTILDENKHDITSELVIPVDKVGKTYQLNATVEFPDISSDAGAKLIYATPSEKGLAEFSDNKLTDLSWNLMTENAPATIDQKGLLSITGQGEFQVMCSTSLKDGEEGKNATYSITVKVGEATPIDDPQGENKPEPSLTIVADASAFAAGDDTSSGDGSGQASSSGASSGTSASSGAASSAASNSSGASSDPSSGGVYAQDPTTSLKPGEINRTYDAAALEKLASDDLQLFHVPINEKTTSITGKGVPLMDLLRSTFQERNLDLDSLPIQSVTFETRTVKQTIPWDYLKSAKASALIATKSYVHGKSDPADKPVDASKLVDNTRFRLLLSEFADLPESASKNADDYRWINKIEVNFAKSDSDRLAVNISYRPVPKGEDATLVAVPNHNVTGSWNCYWEVSADGKTGWSSTGTDGQTLTVPTNNETIGKWYRVTIKNDTGSAEDPEGLLAISEPEQLREGKGVVLKYNPPQAGQMAVFRTFLIGVDASMVKEYIWQASIDGGATWNYAEDYLKNKKNSTLELKTNPVDSSGSSGGGGDGGGATPPLIYFKVTVVLKENVPDFERESNVQPFTVHVGDEDTDTGGGKDSSQKDGDGGADGVPSQSSTNPPSSGNTSQFVPTPTVTEVQNITVEDAPAATQALDSGGTPNPAAPQQQGDPTQLYVNDEVTQAINEQQKEAKEQVQSTVPGARWTALNTLNPTSDDVRRVLDNNPIAPLIIPTGLGIFVAGGLERLLFFRRQL